MTAFPIAGVGSYAQMYWESTYGTKATGTYLPFGHGTKISVSRKNNIEKVYGLGSRDSTSLVPKQYEGNFSVDFVMASPWFLKAFTGKNPSKAGAGPYEYTYTENGTVGSFTLENGFDLDTDRSIFLKGCKCNNMTITAAVNEVAKVKMDGNYKSEEKAASLTAITSETFEPYCFVQGSLQFPSGTTIGDVQSCEISMTNNIEGVYGLGSRFNTAQIPKQADYSFRVTAAFEDPTKLLDLFYGSASGSPAGTVAETASLVFTFSNSGTGTAARIVTMTFANLKIDEESLNQDPNEVIKEDITIQARTMTSIVCINNTSTEP